jgi:glycosyltransferase involved in cell wall biosynthesis
MRAMRILVICSGHALDDDRVTRKQARSLARLGHDVAVCAWRRYEYQEPGVRLLDLAALMAGDSKPARPRTEVRRKDRLLSLRMLWKLACRERPDLLVAHEFETGLLAWWLHFLHGIPYVFDVHEFYEETIAIRAPKAIRGLVRSVVRRLLWRVARRAQAATVVSPAAERFFKEGAPNVPVAVLYNSPPMEYFPFSDREGPVPVIVHEGTLSLDRGALEMLEALALVRESQAFRFLVLGTISAEVREAFEKQIDRLGLRAVVDMPGRLPWTEFGKLEASGQIGLVCMQPLPNNMKGLSNKLFDYMSCGLAVIGPKMSASEELLEKFGAGICVDTTQPKEIADAICLLICNPDMRRKMAANGRKAVETELGWHCMEQVMGRVYGAIAMKLKDHSDQSVNPRSGSTKQQDAGDRSCG